MIFIFKISKNTIPLNFRTILIKKIQWNSRNIDTLYRFQKTKACRHFTKCNQSRITLKNELSYLAGVGQYNAPFAPAGYFAGEIGKYLSMSLLLGSI